VVAAPVTIRSASVEDVDVVHELEVRWAAEGVTLAYSPATTSALSSYVGECFFVAEHAGATIGFVVGQTKTEAGSNQAVVPKGERYLEVLDLYVLPEHRSSGVGRTLMDTAAAWAKQKGIRYILVYSATKDVDRILRFYRSCGFQSWFVQLFRDLGRDR
jgi:ribosomal protein S18 acetylase RimI-like enzyme